MILASTLSPSYGVYSGYEHFEHEPVHTGSEEYLDSEKYQVRERDLDGPLMPLIARLNDIRRRHPALQEFANIAFLETENDALIAYAKRTGDDVVITVVSLDPASDQEGVCIVPSDLGLPPSFAVEDELVSGGRVGSRYHWRLGRNYVRLAPGQAHILGVHQ